MEIEVCGDCFRQIKFCKCGNPSGKIEKRYIGKIKFIELTKKGE